MKGRNGSTSFLPSKRKGGFQREISEQCLTKDQTKHIYDKIEIREMVKLRKLDQQDVTSSPKQVTFMNDANQYEKALLSDRNMKRGNNSQIKQWSILSDNIIYVKSEDRDIMNGIHIKPIDYREYKRMYRKMNKEGGERIDIDFGESLEVTKSRCMDVYDNVYAEVVMTNRFDESVDLSTTYLGRIDMKREEVLKAEESFPISEQGFVKERIQVGNGQYVGVLLVILVIVEINKHRLEVFTLISEIFDNVNMVLGIKNLFELEGVIDTRESSFRFLSRSIPIFP